jgi:hypothetical protein
VRYDRPRLLLTVPGGVAVSFGFRGQVVTVPVVGNAYAWVTDGSGQPQSLTAHFADGRAVPLR